MKRLIYSMLFGLCISMSVVPACAADFTVSMQYGNKRPYSFYYPYNYKYYYPRPEYHRSSQACYWLYTNGTYVYYCE